MEDEGRENGRVDTWSLWEEAYFKGSAIQTTPEQFNNSNVPLDEVEEYRENCFGSPYTYESVGNGNSTPSLKNVIKGFEHPILEETDTDLFGNISSTQVAQHNKAPNKRKSKAVRVKTEKMAEYAQYLGLQPASSKIECKNCESAQKSSSTSGLNLNQCDRLPETTCLQVTKGGPELSLINSSEVSALGNSSPPLIDCGVLPLPSSSESSLTTTCEVLATINSKLHWTNNSNLLQSDYSTESQSIAGIELPFSTFKPQSSMSTEPQPSTSHHVSTTQPSNYKISRKVYLCAACETYFENWNLFLHMREVHKRHICLFCLGMFAEAERLSYHLSKKHSVPEIAFNSVEEFHDTFKGSCYIVCCLCEKIFSETDNFYDHICPPQDNQESISEIYSPCVQSNNHTEACSSVVGKGDKMNNLQYPVNSSKFKARSLFAPSLTGVSRHSKRTIKPNKLNDDVYVYTKLTNIRSKRLKLLNTSDTTEVNACTISALQKNVSAIEHNNIQQVLSRDSVANAGIEINKDVQDLSSNQSNKHINNTLHNVHENIPINSDSAKTSNDSVPETITEVSRFVNSPNNSAYWSKSILNRTSVVNALICHIDTDTVESSDPKSEDDVRLNEVCCESEKTKDSENHVFTDAGENSNLDSESQASNNPSSSSSPSLFTAYGADSRKSELETQPVLSVTPVTDRSLVIKICTKNNSVFSISMPSAPRRNSSGNYDSSRESEENNNGEGSYDKISVLDEKEGAQLELFTNTQNSDSDNNKLAIIDDSTCNSGMTAVAVESCVKRNKRGTALNKMDGQQQTKMEVHTYVQNKQKIVECSNEVENFDGILLAGEEIPIADLDVDSLLENTKIEDLLKLCIKAVSAICVYCNHARHIAVNGKQLSLHMLAEHRFQPQHPAIIIHQEQFTAKVKKYLQDLESYYFNLDSYNSKEGTYNVSTVKVYECFHCRFYSSAHKELYLHNRKMHQKSILICVMCKSTFCSYSELLCHLCPGVYAANVNVHYRCCLCTLSNLPSSFRLMVHLRKKHHACDVCLESTGNQQRLSNHVWKHKLHHLCYRCGIAYRNKPDITKHLFWKHGTESILCRKCLQKKWPHVYHFCIPPTAFACEECGFTFSRAIALKVHKRTHTRDFPYACSECPEKFISKKLLTKHEQSHQEPTPSPVIIVPLNTSNNQASIEQVHVDVCNVETKENEATIANAETTSKEPVKKVIDVYDLPPLNLSSDSDSEIEDEKLQENTDERKLVEIDGDSHQLENLTSDSSGTTGNSTGISVEVKRNEKEKKQEKQIMDGIWDNFKSYTASLEKQDFANVTATETTTAVGEEKQDSDDLQSKENNDLEILKSIILADHDYCTVYSNKVDPCKSYNKTLSKIDNNTVIEQNFHSKPQRTPPCTANVQNTENGSSKKKVKSTKKKKKKYKYIVQ